MMTRNEETLNFSLSNLLVSGVSDLEPRRTKERESQVGDAASDFIDSAEAYPDLGRVWEEILPTPPPPID